MLTGVPEALFKHFKWYNFNEKLCIECIENYNS